MEYVIVESQKEIGIIEDYKIAKDYIKGENYGD